MEYVLKSGPLKKDRYTIGFLDDNQNNDFHIKIMSGIAQAAKELDIDIIRFSYYSSHIAYKFSHQVNMVLDHIQQYDLDGLMFLGWTEAGAMYNSDFQKRFSSLPLFSIGTAFDDIPCVYFAGEEYIGGITEHLIKEHNLKRIAFVEHNRPDSRKEAYIKVMKQFGLYDPMLYISSEALEGLSMKDRSKRAIEILLDERGLDIEAIISLKVEETVCLTYELDKRGIRIPDDIAVTCYENDNMARYTSPGLTTIHYPWRELGYNACIRMAELLNTGHVPMVTSLNGNGKVIYRRSCGCRPLLFFDMGKNAKACNLHNISENEIGQIIRSLTHTLKYVNSDTATDIVRSFFMSFKDKDKSSFLTKLSMLVKGAGKDNNIEDVLFAVRREICTYLGNDIEGLIWSGDLFMQAQTLINKSVLSLQEAKKNDTRKVETILQELRRRLLTQFKMDNLIGSLEIVLPELGIPGCHLFIFNSTFDREATKGNLYDNNIQIFSFASGKKVESFGKAGKLAQQMSSMLRTEGKNIYLSYLLHVTDEVLGFVLFEPGPMDEILYQALTVQISTALRGIQLINTLNVTYKRFVEHAYREGMADIAANTLHNIGNILNSAVISVQLMDEITMSPFEDNMALAGSILRENIDKITSFICNDPKGKILMNFYLKLGEQAKKTHQQLHYNIYRLQDRIRAISDEISAQQTYAGIDNKLEELSIEQIIEDALKLNKAYLDYHGISIVRNYEARFKAKIHRARLFFVFANIISNAEEAMLENCADKRLIVRMHKDISGKYLRITDTGRGIPKENLSLIFGRGFTTKADKSGNGLYSCKAYMNDMGGIIIAESEGEGKGSTFILKFEEGENS